MKKEHKNITCFRVDFVVMNNKEGTLSPSHLFAFVQNAQ